MVGFVKVLFGVWKPVGGEVLVGGDSRCQHAGDLSLQLCLQVQIVSRLLSHVLFAAYGLGICCTGCSCQGCWQVQRHVPHFLRMLQSHHLGLVNSNLNIL